MSLMQDFGGVEVRVNFSGENWSVSEVSWGEKGQNAFEDFGGVEIRVNFSGENWSVSKASWGEKGQNSSKRDKERRRILGRPRDHGGSHFFLGIPLFRTFSNTPGH